MSNNTDAAGAIALRQMAASIEFLERNGDEHLRGAPMLPSRCQCVPECANRYEHGHTLHHAASLLADAERDLRGRIG